MPCDIVSHDAPTSCQPIQHSLSFWPHKCFVEIKRSEKNFSLGLVNAVYIYVSLLDKVGSSGINHP